MQAIGLRYGACAFARQAPKEPEDIVLNSDLTGNKPWGISNRSLRGAGFRLLEPSCLSIELVKNVA